MTVLHYVSMDLGLFAYKEDTVFTLTCTLLQLVAIYEQ